MGNSRRETTNVARTPIGLSVLPAQAGWDGPANRGPIIIKPAAKGNVSRNYGAPGFEAACPPRMSVTGLGLEMVECAML